MKGIYQGKRLRDGIAVPTKTGADEESRLNPVACLLTTPPMPMEYCGPHRKSLI
jgi:hypothetical protein